MRKDPLRRLAEEPAAARKRKGTLHTPGEILQQPWLWRDTAERAVPLAAAMRKLLDRSEFLLFTGAGSSLHAAQLLEHEARGTFGPAVSSVSCTDLMLSPGVYIPRAGRGILFSLSRSGESPESVEAARAVARVFPRVDHVAITCNRRGRLARSIGRRPRGVCLFLHERAYDRGLGTTSSMTSTVVGGYALLSSRDPDAFTRRIDATARSAEALLRNSRNAEFQAGFDYERVVFLGTGPLEAAAREAAHKVLELTDGQVDTMARSPLEFRHGPIAFINRKTLIDCMLSPNPWISRYDVDVVKQLAEGGHAHVIYSYPGGTGGHLPGRRASLPPAGILAPSDAALLAIVYGQMLALFISLRRGLKPDRPGNRGLVNPVVQGVTIYPPQEKRP